MNNFHELPLLKEEDQMDIFDEEGVENNELSVDTTTVGKESISKKQEGPQYYEFEVFMYQRGLRVVLGHITAKDTKEAYYKLERSRFRDNESACLSKGIPCETPPEILEKYLKKQEEKKYIKQRKINQERESRLYRESRPDLY